jgi:hypothetical protein
MSENLLSTHRNLRNSAFLFIFLLSFSPFSSGQNEGVSIHGDFFSGAFVYGFDQNYDHPGNFLLGVQYNYPATSLLEFNGGLDFLWVELYGSIKGQNKQTEVFIPFIFGGAALNFDQWKIFGKIGYSLSGSVNVIGSRQGWVSSILNFNMGSFQLGLLFPVTDVLSISTSGGYYFGHKIQVETSNVTFSTFNIGLNYNLFSSKAPQPVLVQGVDEYKEKYLASQSENKALFNEIVELHAKINALSTSSAKVDTNTLVPNVTTVETISVDSLNNYYNLHIGEPLNLKDFVNKRGLKEEGRLILEEYNSLAITYKRLPEGIYFICTVPDNAVFLKNEADFPRIKFRSDRAVRNKLIIDIDIKTTELNNKVKLEFK